MELCLIWAQDRTGAIGKDNSLPWSLPEDLEFFKRTTTGCPLIMGRRTYESLPPKGLPGRQGIVLSRKRPPAPSWAVFTGSFHGALLLAGVAKPARTFVIGGSALFKEALPVADTVFITRIDTEVLNADTFAPHLPDEFMLLSESARLTSRTGLSYQVETWIRRPSLGAK
jgi:dihydrofolate reductase